jgi:hypothetical protein
MAHDDAWWDATPEEIDTALTPAGGEDSRYTAVPSPSANDDMPYMEWLELLALLAGWRGSITDD